MKNPCNPCNPCLKTAEGRLYDTPSSLFILIFLQNLIQQEGGILVSCHALLYLISIGNIRAQIYLETIVVEFP